MNMVSNIPSIEFAELLESRKPLLDLRAPVEFQRGSIPGAVNIPILRDEERRLVGIAYKEEGQPAAIELGKKLVDAAEREKRCDLWAAWAASHHHGALYCMRGGLRSHLAQEWLAARGISVPLIEGGYKALRSFLITTLERSCTSHPWIVLGGRTGVGKTLLLKELNRSVDLEGRAEHRGSSFGHFQNSQPSQIDFENRIALDMLSIPKDSKRAWLEDESRFVGRVLLPDCLRETMSKCPVVILEADMATRVKHGIEDYVCDLLRRYQDALGMSAGLDEFKKHHRESLDRIKKRLGGGNLKKAHGLLEVAFKAHESEGTVAAYEPFIEFILSVYYDPMYDYQLSKKENRIVFRGDKNALIEWDKDRSTRS